MSHTTLRPAERVLLEMADVPSAQRLRWLARRCATEPALLAEVQALVDQFEAPDEPTGVPARALHAPLTGHAGLLVPGTEIDDFTILGLLGAGASGVAYIARQELLGREVALKVLRTSSSASAQKRFELEAEVLARLDHPGIARVYASRGPRSDCPAYIAMELVEGEAITDYVAAQTLPVPACLELVARVCDAVHHAHQRGVIHRDLKPGNILVTSDGHPKVLDFGVARLVHAAAGGSDHETQIGQMVGTLPYMSPEQLAGDPGDLDIRTDVYALGVLLYHLLSGVLPFDFAEMSLGDAARAICQRDPLRLEVRRPGLPPDVCIVIACAMARIRERRYDSAAELAADLRRAATGVPIAAHRDSALLTLLHRLRRSRLVATAAAAGLIGVAGLAGYAIVQRTEARAAADALAAELARSTVERGRLLGRMGNLPVAEQMLWQRTLADPEAGASRWALRELYARYTSMWETQAHAQEVTVVRFSADDRLAISGGRDGRVQVLRARDGEPQRHWTDHGAARVIDAGFLAAGRAYSIDEQGMVVVHDVAADAPVHVWKLPDLEVRNASLLSADRLLLAAVRGGAAAPQGELVAVSLVDGTARTIWTAPPGLPVDCVAPSPEGDAVVVGDARGGLTVVELTSGRVRWQSAGHEAPVARVAWSPDGRWLASGSSDRTVRLWEARSGRLSRALTAGNGTARSVAFSADSRQIVSAGWWRVEIWDVETGLLVRDDIGASQGWYDARFNSAGDRLLVGSAQGGIRLWDLSAPLVLHPPSPAAPPSVSFDTDRAALHAVIGRTDGRLDVLHAGGQPLTARHGDLLAQVAVDAAGRMFASAGANPMLRVWRHDSNGAVPLLTLPDGDALAVAMSADGRLVAVGEVGGRLTVVRTDDGQTLYTVPGGDGDLLAVRFDATGAELFTGYRDRRIVVRAAADGRVVREMQSTSAPFVFAYHAPTGRLAAGTWAGAIDVWSAATGERLASLTGHARLVTDLDFLAADVLLSTGRDGTVRAWSLSQPSELALLRQRSVGGEGVRVVDDGQRLALMFEDGHAELFDLTALDARIAGHRNAQRTPRPEPR